MTAILQFQRDGNRLLASFLQGAERVDSVPFSDAALLETWSGAYQDLMEKALAFPLNDHRPTLEEFGRCLYDNLLTGDLGAHLRTVAPTSLIVDLPESLLWLPVEIMFDGSEFLGTRHALGRRITAWEGIRPVRRGEARMDGARRPSFLLVAGHAEDDAFFEETRREIYDLCSAIETSDAFELRELLVDNSIARPELLRAISGADFIHFSGHSDDARGGRAGWVFEEFRLAPDEVSGLAGCDPFFVFSNSCRSSSVSNWQEVRDMVRAFWERGTRHFIGANTRIHYKRAAEFAEAFYRAFLGGDTIGDAVRAARLAVLNNPAHHDACWLSYVLYGDPGFRLPRTEFRKAADREGARHTADRRAAEVPLLTRSGAHATPAPTPGAPAAFGPATSAFAEAMTCAWSGKPILPSSATRCAHPGCGKWLGLDAQIEQRRLRLDMAIHAGGAQPTLSGAGAFFCREHLPADMTAWMEKSRAASHQVQTGGGACAWTGRTASRSDLLAGTFTQTPHGLMSPEARATYTCAQTGAIIPPHLAREDRGFIRHRGRTFSEDGYWKSLGFAAQPAVPAGEAEAVERRVRGAMVERLRALGEVVVGARTYTTAELGEPLRETEQEVAWKLTLGGGLFRGGLRVGIVERVVVHPEHMARFGRDRAPATLADLDRTSRFLEPLAKCDVTLFILSSPTGWSAEACDHVRQLEPGASAMILRFAGDPSRPLVFSKKAEVAEALKLELAGGARLVV